MRIFLIIVAALAVIGFSAQPIFGMDGFSLFGEVFMCTLVLAACLVPAATIVFVVLKCKINEDLAAWMSLVSVVVCAGIGLTLIGASLVASSRMADLKRRFIIVAETYPRTEHEKSGYVPEGGPHGEYSYGGVIDTIIARRDARLAKMGYRGCSGWYIMDSGVHTHAFYWWWPFGRHPDRTSSLNE